ncbi:hypothetical protein [Fredinandcohnia sp. 179-A 10B2 NHS]|uniref:hypothetical protein n=1 Tax=Fredinandcohnia sp. 179-A 10B2 NHS TaxID=3235176 RepID=UPI0039A297C3
MNNNHMFFKYEAAYRQSNLLTRTPTKMFEDSIIIKTSVKPKEVKPVVDITTCCAPVC